MREGREIRKLGDILIFDKRFNGLPKGQQDRIAHFTHVSAEELKSLKVDDGDVKLISTGLFDGYTTKDLAGSNLNRGEIITIPTGGTANIKYYSGFFVDSGNLIGIARDASICLKYVYFGMTCKKAEINSYYRGVSIKHPFMPDICKITIPIPSVQEQEKIVAELDCLTGIIEKKQQQLEELDKLAQSIFYDMFGDPITNEKGWEVRQMGTFCRCELGKMLDVKKNRGRLLPYLCSINVQWGRFDLSYLKEMRFEDDELERFAVKKGDLMICEGGDAGRCAIWNEDYSVFYQKALHRVRFNESVMLPIVCQFIMMIYKDRGEMDKYCKGQTIKHLVKEILITLPMITPPLDLQNDFAQKIEAIEKQKELVKRSIVETETLFNSRMDYWFN